MELNKIYNENCSVFLPKISDNFIDLVVTSPPYYNLRQYSCWNTYQEHIDDVKIWFTELERVLKPGGHICWNIQENIPEPSERGRHYYPLMPDTVKIGTELGLEWEKKCSVE
jgi:DNA modification methylase